MAELHTAVEGILDSIVNILKAEMETDGDLEDINTIIRGDRYKTSPKPPALWVFAETASPENTSRAIAETWTMPVVMIVVYKNNDTELGYRMSSKYASIARSVVLRERNTRINLPSYVQDLSGGRFEPTGPYNKTSNIYASLSAVNVIFRTIESET